jgi:recombination protein RecT
MSQLAIARSAKDYFSKDIVKAKLQELLGANAATFSTSVLQIVNSSAMLARAEPSSVFNAACTAAVMKLPINANLGYAYIVPYENSKKVDGQWVKQVEAQFQIGAKGFIQLAQRTGLYKRIAYSVVRDGQLTSFDPLMGCKFDWTREGGDVIGYVSYFEMLNGFESYLYMSNAEVDAHAVKFSKSYANDKKNDAQKSNWSTNFEAMALKTVIKLLLSKFGALSIDMQKAIEADQSVVKDLDAGHFDYIDNAATAAGTLQPVDEVAFYPQDQFTTNLPKWKKAIADGKPVDDLIAMIESKAPLTEAQKVALKNNDPSQATTDKDSSDAHAAPLVAADADGVMHNFDQIKALLENAATLDALADAATLINSIKDKKQKATLTAIYEERGAQLN